ncbi:unnamed protein product [Darwinula stevensoni]|uniref:Spaetzle domain-containing protein n=1 Tax=Darwinula stevensoni TaxID=69355 RepID=A0A7R8XEA4_9CRUS|nr:unnamed protein product [Darwinula stevensoni]CAG0887612.1 unnamed protein product [Darwinula stevensoni]
MKMTAVVAVVAADRPSYYQPSTYSYHPEPSYPQPSYGYHPEPSYSPKPSYGYKPQPHGYDAVPACANNETNYCLKDKEYPEYDIKYAISQHKYGFLELYADVADLSTANSVDRLQKLEEETYICPSETVYARPLRAKNTDGKWRIIVNNVKVDYDEFTQSVRLETCTSAGSPCPLIPDCYSTKCLQKSIYHRFLVYDPYDHYFPFAIESFRLPASCACHADEFVVKH